MTRQIKTTLLTCLFIFGLLTGLQAQDKYEYAIISYAPTMNNITISISGNDFKTVDVDKSIKVKDRNFNPALIEVNKLCDNGWELFNTEATGMTDGVNYAVNIPNYIFYLRKKK